MVANKVTAHGNISHTWTAGTLGVPAVFLSLQATP